MDTIWTVYLLGGLSLQRAGADPVPLRLNKPNLLLARLAFSPGEQVARDELIEILWPDALGDRERHSLSAALDTLRHTLEPPAVARRWVLRADRTSVWLNPQAVTTDLVHLQREVAHAHRAADDAEYFTRMQSVVGMYSGDLLQRIDLEWVLPHRESLAAHFRGELQSLIGRLQAAGHLDEALGYALGAVARWPDDEGLYEPAFRLLIALDRHDEVMRRFTALCARLLSTQQRAPAAPIVRLMAPYKDRLNAALRTSSPGVNPHVRQGHAPVGRFEPGSGGLPVYLSRFFGREHELCLLEGMLGGPENGTVDPLKPGKARLVTITGLGGCGKTRLAVEAAERLATAFDGHVLFVPFASSAHSHDLISAVARALKVRASGSAGVERISEKLKNSHWLLVLDNCERATGRARAVRTLLQASLELYVLTTSRIPLKIAGERVVSLNPFPTPQRALTPQQLCRLPSAQMFVDRAQAANAGFRVTDDNASALSAVIGRLEGLPLAIELVAARTVALSPSQILKDLAHHSEHILVSAPVYPGHKSLKHVIDWSFRHLPLRARGFALALSTFRGGFTLDAARAVAGTASTGDLLNLLMQHALIALTARGDVNRYSMLDSLREHAAVRLNPHEKEILSANHSAYYLSLLIETVPRLRTVDQRAALALLDDEQANISAAIENCRGGADELRLAAAAWRYWYFRPQAGAAAGILKRALAVDRQDLPEYAEALHGYGVFLELQDDVAGARTALNASLAVTASRPGLALAHGRTQNSLALLLDKAGDWALALQSALEALDTLRRVGDAWDVAGCLNTTARVHWHLADSRAAEELFREALALFEGLEDWPNAALIRFNVGCLLIERGEFSRARAAFERGLLHFREMGQRAWIAAALHNIGDTIVRQGDPATARPHLIEALILRHELADHSGVAATVDVLAAIAFSSGNVTFAVRLAAAAASVREKYNMPISPGKRAAYEGVLQRYREAATELDFEAAWLFGSELGFDTLVLYATEQRVTPRPDYS